MADNATQGNIDRLARELAQILKKKRLSISVAESLTGGQLCTALAAAEDSGRWFRGGIVAYQSEVKFVALGVPPGPVVTRDAAEAMSAGVLDLLGSDVAVAVTGVGGPKRVEGKDPGIVFVATSVRDSPPQSVKLMLHGSPVEVLQQTIEASLRLLLSRLEK